MKTKKRSYVDQPCRYFFSPGPAHTSAVLEMVRLRADQLGIQKIVIPSYTGKTALVAAGRIDPAKIVVVTGAWGAEKPNGQAMKDETRRKLVEEGCRLVTATHVFGGVGRSVRKKLGTYQVDEIMAYMLRIFGQGTKVAVEIALMAADAGCVRTDEDIISTGGSAVGIDTALVLRPVNTSSFLDMKIREVICKPANF